MSRDWDDSRNYYSTKSHSHGDREHRSPRYNEKDYYYYKKSVAFRNPSPPRLPIFYEPQNVTSINPCILDIPPPPILPRPHENVSLTPSGSSTTLYSHVSSEAVDTEQLPAHHRTSEKKLSLQHDTKLPRPCGSVSLKESGGNDTRYGYVSSKAVSPLQLQTNHRISELQQSPTCVSNVSAICRNAHDSSPITRLGDNTDDIDIGSRLHFRNRFTAMTLTTESLTQDHNLGYSNFYKQNKHRTINSWQKQIILQSSVPEPPKIPSPIVVESKPIKEEFAYNDPFANKRCKKYLRGKECAGSCGKLHRYPREDGVRCYSEKLEQCNLGSRCHYVHITRDSSDCSDDDDGNTAIQSSVGSVVNHIRRASMKPKISVTETNQNKSQQPDRSSTSKKLPLVSKSKNTSAVRKTNVKKEPVSLERNQNSAVGSILQSEGIVKKSNSIDGISENTVKQEPIKDTDTREQTAKSSSSGNSRTTTITTPTTVSEPSLQALKKRKNEDAQYSPQPVKKEKPEKQGNSSSTLKEIKTEPIDEEQLFEDWEFPKSDEQDALPH